MTTSLPYIVPKLDSAETPRASSFVLDSYLCHHQYSRCAKCGRNSETTNVFEVWCLRGAGSVSRRLTPATTVRTGIPIGVSELRARETPICFYCIGDQPGAAEITPEDEWRKTLQRKYAPDAPKPVIVASRTKSTTVIPSLDDL